METKEISWFHRNIADPIMLYLGLVLLLLSLIIGKNHKIGRPRPLERLRIFFSRFKEWFTQLEKGQLEFERRRLENSRFQLDKPCSACGGKFGLVIFWSSSGLAAEPLGSFSEIGCMSNSLQLAPIKVCANCGKPV